MTERVNGAPLDDDELDTTAATDGGASTDGASGALDDPRILARVDGGGMLGQIGAIDAQIRDGWRLARDLALPDAYRGRRSVAVLGMGGSAVGGDLVAGIWSDRLRAPLSVIRGYELPAWVDDGVLVVASSNSGNTEETVTALGQALARGCPVVAVTTGGAIKEAATRAGLPLLTFPGGGMPRAAIGYTIALLVGLLERAGLLPVDAAEIESGAVSAAAAASAFGPDVPTDRNSAKQLAWAFVDRLPVIEAGGFLTPVARRWKTQLNENAKSGAIWEELPEATHNAVVGYPHPDTVTDHLHVAFLTSRLDHPRNRLRASLSAAALDDAGIGHQDVPVSGDTRFASAVHAIVLGDYVSAYLAILYEVDPTPIEALTRIKEALATVSLEPTGSGRVEGS